MTGRDLPRTPTGRSHVTGLPEVPDVDQPFDADGLYAMRATIVAHASGLGARPEQVERLLIVAGELATNAIRHGGGTAHIRLWRDNNRLHLQVSDQGPGMSDLAAGTMPPDKLAMGGRGLWICRQLVPDLHVTTGTQGTTVAATLTLEGDRPGKTRTTGPV